MKPTLLELLAELEATIHHEIPLSRALGLRVAAYHDGALTLQAPLAPNVNHKETAFAGSLNAALTLAGWELIWLVLREAGIAGQIVIQDSSVQYRHPVRSDFVLAIAGALTLHNAGAYRGSGCKGDIPTQYRRVIADGWSDLVQASYHDCRLRWGYAVPTAPREQARLRTLCRQVLAFENHFLQHYRAFLQAELHHPDPTVVQRAAARLEQLRESASQSSD